MYTSLRPSSITSNLLSEFPVQLMVAGREENLRDKTPYGCRNGSHNLLACMNAFLIVHITVHRTWYGSVPTSKTTRAVSFFLKSDVQRRRSSTQEKTKPHIPPSLKTCSSCEDLLLIGQLAFVDQLNPIIYYTIILQALCVLNNPTSSHLMEKYSSNMTTYQ